MARSIFASFHYDVDAHRVQQVLRMGAIEGDSLVTAQDWETIKRKTTSAIQAWIHDQMLRKSAVVVLVGSETASRDWVRYEIEKAWNDRRPLVGIRIHGLKNLAGSTGRRGANPFAQIGLEGGTTLDRWISLHDPAGADSRAKYASIAENLDAWIGNATVRG